MGAASLPDGRFRNPLAVADAPVAVALSGKPPNVGGIRLGCGSDGPVMRDGADVEQSDEILRGLADIAAFFGVERKTASGLVKAGLPVARLGLPLVTTRRLAIEWLEARCKEKA